MYALCRSKSTRTNIEQAAVLTTLSGKQRQMGFAADLWVTKIIGAATMSLSAAEVVDQIWVLCFIDRI